ncbi:hypothetical protein DOTSEDRAFT_74105 [Dothistroma septosporum NZE10]|uniref:Uncharacterized protein n=1 Tax=Dothistroma septosporum (strain NZE10 / CBS 128990) TaxID=675120 RepID=N1PDG3_DOTSN|nr:hypothetical protein DOTSEDRAFT_74105 [Dothistroma septosporum NZE10]
MSREIQLGVVDPFRQLHGMLASNEADTDVIRVCLLGAKDLTLAKKPRRARKEWLRGLDVPFAAKVLDHIWSNNDVWAMLIKDDAATWALCYFAVAEGFGDLVLERISMDIDLSEYAESHKLQHRWRGSLLRLLISAHAFNEQGHSLDAALASFFHIDELKTNQSRMFSTGHLSRLSRFPAIVELSSHLTSGLWFNTDADLFERYYKLVPRITKGKPGKIEERFRENAWGVARLALYHPLRPDAEPAIDHLQTRKQLGLLAPTPAAMRKGFEVSMVRAKAVADSNNEHENAFRLSQEFQRLFGNSIPPADRYHKITGRTNKYEIFRRRKQTAPTLPARAKLTFRKM